ncbi:MAG: Ger(x)C family spore germination protein [Oscillospiraceae bacterium]|nr:Ger(x)C family spore germination protein [Oscillospiraceae bacterium]
MKYKLLACVLCLILCTGCWDKSELEDQIFVVMMGIDKHDSENVNVTVAFPMTGASGGEDKMEYSVMRAAAPSVVEALNLFSTKLAGPLSYFSTKTIVISEELAKDEALFQRVVSSWRYEQMRNNTNVMISSCKASDFIEARMKDPIIDLLHQEDLILEQANFSAYYTPVQFLDLIINMKTGKRDGAAMYGGVAEEAKDNVKDGYLPGEIPVESDNKTQLGGLAIFSGGKMAGALSSGEAQTYAMMIKSRTRKILTLPDPQNADGSVVVSILPNSKSKIHGHLNGGSPVFDITVNLNCIVENVTKDTDYTTDENHAVLTEEITKICTENMESLMKKLQELNADTLNLGDKLTRHFKTTQEWEDYNWNKIYKDAEIRIHVNLEIDRAGIVKA